MSGNVRTTSSTVGPATLRTAMTLFEQALRQHREELDSLNVYPVPDGDTGTNMHLTQQAVVAALEAVDDDGDVGDAIARASLMGARGNSGVILSQILRGLCEVLLAGSEAGAADVARALTRANDEAWRAVSKPVEGTVLSVLREASDAASSTTGDVADVLRAAVEAARRSLSKTKEIHPDLKRAGVVDAGGKGIVLLLDALLAAVEGTDVEEPAEPMGPVRRDAAGDRRSAPTGDTLAFEVQYLVEGEDGAVSRLRKELSELGDSLVIVGGGGLYNVHVHTNDAGPAVEAALGAGRVRNISIVDLREQVDACIAGQARGVRLPEQTCALVAVAEGEGLRAALSSLGAVVVPGGAGREPSVDELAGAIGAVDAVDVVVLPNHPDVVAVAERAAERASKRVHVVAATSFPAGLAAATVFNPTADVEENVEAMGEAASLCRVAEVAKAERDSETADGDAIGVGDWVVAVDGETVAAADSPRDAIGDAVDRLSDGDAELVTLLVGEGGAAERDEVEAAIRDAFPDVRLEVIDGGQPGHPFLIGVE